jgi:DNA-binding response OmpR family regulator
MPEMLIADDNRQIVSILAEYARRAGYSVQQAFDGQEALAKAESTSFEIILLDVMMPAIDGFEVCRQIRRNSVVPIIMVTAREEDFERIMGLDIGADDYIVKPFSPAEVMARVRAVLRRVNNSSQGGSQITRQGGLLIDLNRYIVMVDSQRIALSKKEVEILWTLAEKSGMVFTRENILESVWGSDYNGDSRTVYSHIKRLRAKLDAVSHPDWQIVTVWGVGYRFEVLA